MQHYYDEESNRRSARDLFTQAMTSVYGESAQTNPYVDPITSSVRSSGQPGIVSSLIDVLLMNTVGIRNPFVFPALNEPLSGDLGAYAFGRFPMNAGKMGAASAEYRATRRNTFTDVLLGNPMSKRLFTELGSVFGPENVQGFVDSVRSGISGPWSDFGDLGADMLYQFFGMPDYGQYGIRAAKRAEALYAATATPEARAILTDRNILSRNWQDRITSGIQGYNDAARAFMYETINGKTTPIRREENMRGFSDTDVSSILEQVAASATGGEDLKERFEKVGKAAIRTLEAYRDLFGSAEDAKRVLGQVTAGGAVGFNETALDRLTTQARGLQALGTMNGLSAATVGNMIASGMAGVQSALGYTAGDIAGGYSNATVAQAITTGFVANELANNGNTNLNPVELQRLRARATWRAVQFARSGANRAIMAYEFAVKNNAIGERERAQFEDLIASGDTRLMGRAAEIVAGSIGMPVERMLSDSSYKIFSEAVASDSERMADFTRLGFEAAHEEDFSTAERAEAGAVLSHGRNMARAAGFSSQEIRKSENRARYESLIGSLKESADPAAKALANAITKVKNANSNDGDEGYSKAVRSARGLIANISDARAAATIITRSETDAANTLEGLARQKIKANGTTAAALRSKVGEDVIGVDGEISRIDVATLIRDAEKYARNVGDSGMAERTAEASRLLNTGTEANIGKALDIVGGIVSGVDEGTAALMYGRSRFEGPNQEARMLRSRGPSVATARDIVDDIVNGRAKVRRVYSNGGSGHVDSLEDIRTAANSVISSLEDIALNPDRKYGKLFDDEDPASRTRGYGFADAVTGIRSRFDSLGSDATFEDVQGVIQEIIKVRNEYSKELSGTKASDALKGAIANADFGGKANPFNGVSIEGFLNVLGIGTNAYRDIVTFGNGTSYNEKELREALVGAAGAAGIDISAGAGSDETQENIDFAELVRRIDGALNTNSDDVMAKRAAFFNHLSRNGVTARRTTGSTDGLTAALAGVGITASFGPEMTPVDFFRRLGEGQDRIGVAEPDKYAHGLVELADIAAKSGGFDENGNYVPAPGSAYQTPSQSILAWALTGNATGILGTILNQNRSEDDKNAALGKIRELLGGIGLDAIFGGIKPIEISDGAVTPRTEARSVSTPQTGEGQAVASITKTDVKSAISDALGDAVIKVEFNGVPTVRIEDTYIGSFNT